MQKAAAIAFITLLLITTPVFAAPGNGRGNSEQAKENHGKEVSSEKKTEVLADEVTPTGSDDPTPTGEENLPPTVSPTVTKQLNFGQLKKVAGVSLSPTQCDPNAQWKNHGAYVSCVAKTHPGGEVVSAAARSDIGKKHVSVTPSATPSASPTEEPTVSPSPITGPEEVLELASSPLQNFFKAVGRFLKGLPFFPHTS